MTVLKNEKQVTNLQLVEIDHQKFAVELLDGNVNVNLTQMAKPFGRSKQPIQWLKTEASKSYLEMLSVLKKSSTADLLNVKQGGQNQGTWCTDYRIAMRFAQWLSPEFSIAVDGLLVNLMRGDTVLAKPINGVEPTITNSKAVYNYHDALKSVGRSCRSGSASELKRKYPQHFVMLWGRNFITVDLFDLLRRKQEYRQLEIDFMANNLMIGEN